MATVDVLFEGLQLMMKKFHIELQADKSKFLFLFFLFPFWLFNMRRGKERGFNHFNSFTCLCCLYVLFYFAALVV